MTDRFYLEIEAYAKAHIPCVVKFDGLANGKGVWVIKSENDIADAITGLRKLFDTEPFDTER